MLFHQVDFWPERDLEYVVRLLMPDHPDPKTMAQNLRGDPELLDEMLNDDRLFDRLMNDTEQVLNVSGRLFFSVLLNRARIDLKEHPFTFERDNRFGVVVFDTAAVLDFLEDRAVRSYLAAVLASFVRIENKTIFVRAGNSTFRKIRVNDLDIEGLIEISSHADDDQRVFLFKRIGEICLFLIGVFSDYIEAQQALPGAWYRSKSKRELAECGSYYFRAASRQASKLPSELEHSLARISEEFQLATKPLNFISRKYLGYIERSVFLQ